MPLRPRRKDVVLLLPPTNPASSSSAPHDRPESSKMANASQAHGYTYGHTHSQGALGYALPINGYAPAYAPPLTLDMLLYAQQVAWQSGQQLDVEAFMTPQMRAEWLARAVPYYQAVEAGRAGAYSNGPSGASGKRRMDVDGLGDELDRAGGEGSDRQREMEVDTTSTGKAAPRDIHDHDPTGIKHTAPRKSKHPNPLFHAQWKHRKKARRRGSGDPGADGDPVLVDGGQDGGQAVGTSAPMLPNGGLSGPAQDVGPEASVLAGPHGHGKKGEATEADRAGIQASASYWNHLLVQARKARGPQWDYNTQQHHVDQLSTAYYSHMGKRIALHGPGNGGVKQEGPAGVGKGRVVSGGSNGDRGQGLEQRNAETVRPGRGSLGSGAPNGLPSVLGGQSTQPPSVLAPGTHSSAAAATMHPGLIRHTFETPIHANPLATPSKQHSFPLPPQTQLRDLGLSQAQVQGVLAQAHEAGSDPSSVLAQLMTRAGAQDGLHGSLGGGGSGGSGGTQGQGQGEKNAAGRTHGAGGEYGPGAAPGHAPGQSQEYGRNAGLMSGTSGASGPAGGAASSAGTPRHPQSAQPPSLAELNLSNLNIPNLGGGTPYGLNGGGYLGAGAGAGTGSDRDPYRPMGLAPGPGPGQGQGAHPGPGAGPALAHLGQPGLAGPGGRGSDPHFGQFGQGHFEQLKQMGMSPYAPLGLVGVASGHIGAGGAGGGAGGGGVGVGGQGPMISGGTGDWGYES